MNRQVHTQLRRLGRLDSRALDLLILSLCGFKEAFEWAVVGRFVGIDVSFDSCECYRKDWTISQKIVGIAVDIRCFD